MSGSVVPFKPSTLIVSNREPTDAAQFQVEMRLDGSDSGIECESSDWNLMALSLGRTLMGILYPGGEPRVPWP